MRPGHFDSAPPTPVQVSFAATPNLYPSASLHPTMSPDGCTRASETPAKAPNKGVFKQPKHRRIRTRACDFGLVPPARGEAVTNTSARAPLYGTTRYQTEARGGLGMADAREVMNIRQASQYLGVSPDTLYKYVSEERIPAFKLGNRWKFKQSVLEQWMEEKSTQTQLQDK